MSKATVQSRFTDALKHAYCYGPVPEVEIAKAEGDLGLKFPPSLRIFLSAFGAAFGELGELAGLPIADRLRPAEMPQWSDLVVETERTRAGWSLFPHSLIFVSHDGAECSYFLDTAAAAGADGEGPVIALEPGRDFVPVATSYLEFVERLARGERL
jgi:hypothetical protein